ncbi:MAG: hypothetical protein N2486_02200 [Caloramator sp.]|nr:hypothetical protein [Caloramator sp.]
MEKVIVIAILTEAIWETLKMTKKEKYFNVDRIGAILVSVFICIIFDLDIFSMYLGLAKVNYIGNILTGILISRGSNFIHDILGMVSSLYQSRKMSS